MTDDVVGSVRVNGSGLVAWALDELPAASFIVFDSDLRFVLTRGSALADNGVLPSELEGRLVAQALPPERWAFYEPLYRGALTGKSSEITVASPDGLKSYVVRVGPVAGPDGHVLGGVAIASDVTEQTAAAHALEFSERRFRTAMYGAGVGTALVDAQGHFEEVNDALCTILGYSRGDLVGRTFAEVTHPEDVLQSRAGLAALQSGGLETFRIRKRYLTGAGDVVWVDVTANALRGDDGMFLGAITQMVDVTVEVEELAALTASESRYRLLVENIAEVVFHQVDGIVLWISPSVQGLLGWTPEDLIGSATVDLWHPDDRGAAVVMRDAAYAGQPGQAILRFRHKDGRYLWLEVSMAPAEAGEHGGMVGALRDVSERVEAEAALAASEHQFRLLAENATDVVSLVAEDGAITWVSPSAEGTLGWDPAHVVGRKGSVFVHPDDVQRWSEAAGAVMGGEAGALEYRFRRPDGTYLWVSAVSSPIVDPEGHVRGRVASIRDVDEAVRGRRQLQESEERFRLAMDNSAAGMSLVSPTGAFLRVNAALCTFLGRTRDELLSSTWPQVTHPDDLARDVPLVQDVLEGRRDSLRLRKRYLRQDGSIVWGDLAMGPVRNDDGSVRYMVVQVIDATEHVVAERMMAEQAESLRAILDNSRDGISRFDPQLRVEFINQRGVHLSGIPLESWLGRTLAELGYPSDITENWNAHIASVFATGASDVFEYQVDNTEGTRWYEASLSAEFGVDGSVAHVISANRDITARHLAEDELRHLATHDPLTALANRTAVGDEIDRSLRAGRRSGHATAVLMVDLDRFQYVNDSLGHSVGDDLLRAAGDRIAGSVRGGDLVGRMGGDEFCVVMRDLEDPAEALTAAWRLVTDFRASFLISGEEVFTTASIGVTVASGRSRAQDLLREADTALFVAKGEGRDRVSVFNDDLRAAVTTRLRLEGDLRHALERESSPCGTSPRSTSRPAP